MQYGMELDAVTKEVERIVGGGAVQAEPTEIYKIEVGANRSDLLCVEGIANALKTFI